MPNGLLVKATLPLMFFIAHASQASEIPERNFNVGVTSYATVISYDDTYNYNSQEELFGGGLAASYAFTNNFAARVNFGFLSHDSFSDIDSNTAELSLLFGHNLARSGWKAYGGIGMFHDKWKVKNSNKSETFSGPLLTGGVGYQWNRVSFEFWLSFRQSSEYSLNSSTDLVGSGGWLIGYRF